MAHDVGPLSVHEWPDDEYRHRWLISNREAKGTSRFCGQPLCAGVRETAHSDSV